MRLTEPKPIASSDVQTWSIQLDGAADLVKAFDMPPHATNRHVHANERRALTMAATSSFFGCKSEPEARAILLKGWPEGGRIVSKLAEQIAEKVPPPRSRRRVRRWYDEGDEASYERMQQGHEYVWQSTHRKLKSACGLIELVMPWGSGCGTNADALKWNGAAAIAVADLLEKADFAVELCIVTALGDGDRQFGARGLSNSLMRVDLKDMGTYCDMEQLAAVAMYPPAYRIYGLAAFQLSPFSAGDNFSSHPHFDHCTKAYAGITTLANNPDRLPTSLWGYRPNVMTVVLDHSFTEAAAIEHATQAIKAVHQLVDPDYKEAV